MPINVIDNIDATHKTYTNNGVGLCYFDPHSESLRELSDNSLNIAPFEENVRRYYLTVDTDGAIPSTATLHFSSDVYSLVVKHKVKTLSDSLSTTSEFTSILDSNYTTVFFGQHTTDIIPIDVYIQSTVNVKYGGSLYINIDVEF
jgi:hypothetical protein